MTRLRRMFLTLSLAGFVLPLDAQEQPAWQITDLSGEGGVEYRVDLGIATATNGVLVRYGGGVLTADRVVVDLNSGAVRAEGRVRIQRDDQVWASERVLYNFKTRRFEAQQFRTGAWPVFAAGEGLRAEPRRRQLVALLDPKLDTPNAPSLIGAAPAKIQARDKEGASAALRFPAEPSGPVAEAKTADLNADGFVTSQEVLSLKAAGVSDADVLEKLAATGYIFELTPEQETLLWANGMERSQVELIPALGDSGRAGLAARPGRRRAPNGGSPQSQPEYVYTATNAVITADDISEPFIKIRARQIRIVPGEKVQAEGAVLYIGEVPVFYFPFYSRNLDEYSNRFTFVPGYRSSFGPFLLSSYNWFLGDQFDGAFHVDYRAKRGFGGGPDVNYHLGRFGEGTVSYYYLYDQDPENDLSRGKNPDNRQRVYLSYLAEPWTNTSVRSMIRFQGDTNIVREFFESEYRRNPQPSTFVEANKYWRNFSLDVYTQPRVNDFLETVERLPDVRLTGFRQQVGSLPVYYESESSVGYYRMLFAETNSEPTGLNYSAARADTYHQLTQPHTFFGWLRIVPRVGGRFTHYTEASGPGGFTDDQSRAVFNTGAELSLKASRVMPEVTSKLLDMDGLRHIVEPSANYVFVPRPNARPNELPQFDRELPSFRLLPIEFPDYNAIDSVDSQNVIRLGLRNRFQTKRGGQVESLGTWDIYSDWRLDPRDDQEEFEDIYSDAFIKPRSWLGLESVTRYDTDNGRWRMAYHTVSIRPNDVWSWGLGHYYLRDDYRATPTALGEGNNSLVSTIYYRLNENWGFRTHHRFDVREERLQEQGYTVYRDLRSWTAALTFRVRDNPSGNDDDFSVAFTFSLKAFPRYGLGSDTLRHYTLWGD